MVPATAELDRIRELVRTADDVGLDVVGVQDHPYQARFLDTWSLIPSLLAETSRVSMFTDVANLPLRPPAMMAKAAASLDVLSGGRFDLGLGAGGLHGHRSLGSAARCGRAASRSRHSKRRSTSCGCCGRTRPRSPTRARTTGSPTRARARGRCTRSASGSAPSGRGCCASWVARPTAGCRRWASCRARRCGRPTRASIEAAEQAGRDPRSIRRILNLQGVIGDGPAPARDSLPVGYLAGEPMAGPADVLGRGARGVRRRRLRHARALAGRRRTRAGRAAGAGPRGARRLSYSSTSCSDTSHRRLALAGSSA